MANVNTRGSTLQASRWCPEARAIRGRSADARTGWVSQARECMAKAGFPFPGGLISEQGLGAVLGPYFPHRGLGRAARSPRARLEQRGRPRDPGFLVDAGVLAPLPSGAPSGSGTSGPALRGPAPPREPGTSVLPQR